MNEKKKPTAEVISFADRYLTSLTFDKLYRSAMQLVEDVSEYLHGEGRTAQRKLDLYGKISFKRESNNLTHRMMKISAWTLLAKARSEDDISHDAFMQQKLTTVLFFPHTPEAVLESGLPLEFVELIRRSHTIIDEVRRVDKQFFSHRPR